jgi:hypothetical protein
VRAIGTITERVRVEGLIDGGFVPMELGRLVALEAINAALHAPTLRERLFAASIVAKFAGVDVQRERTAGKERRPQGELSRQLALLQQLLADPENRRKIAQHAVALSKLTQDGVGVALGEEKGEPGT